jgi:hypothetical protein
MPYTIISKNGKYAVLTTAGPHKGRIHGFTTLAKAEAQKRLLGLISEKRK